MSGRLRLVKAIDKEELDQSIEKTKKMITKQRIENKNMEFMHQKAGKAI